MYITRLKKWTNKDWDKYFKQYPAIRTKEQKKDVKKILTGTKQQIEKKEFVLTLYGIVNGIGPGYISALFRGIITFLFGSVKYFWHDIEYSIEGTTKDKIKADNGLLKYSLLGFYDNLIKISDLSLNLLFKVLLVCIYLPLGLIQIIIAVFCWGMVRVFGNSAFSFIEE